MTDLCFSAAGTESTTNPSISPATTVAKKKKTVLLVHHDDTLGLLLRFAFQSEPYVVYETTEWHTALNMCGSLHLDLVLLDMVTPLMDDDSPLRQIRQINEMVSIIVVTALNVKRWIDTAINSGADGFVTKPFNLTTIRQTVSCQLAKGRQKGETRAFH